VNVDSALLIRADAGSQLGTGHVMRCLALAQAYRAVGGPVAFSLATATAALEARLIEEGMSVDHLAAVPGDPEDVSQTIALARKIRAGWVVTDGYQFSSHYQHSMKTAGLGLLFIDDYGHADHYFADLVLNQNLYASETTYGHREPYTRLLLGPRYALLRREFWPWRNWSRSIPSAALRLLITLGGSDPHNTTLDVLRALQSLARTDLEVKVVLGPAYSSREALLEELKSMQGKTELLTAVTDMPGLMAWADLAISAAGSTCWELAFMGVPMITIVQADNQRLVAESLVDSGLACNAGWYTDLDKGTLAEIVERLISSPDLRSRMSRSGRAIVDGMGTQRVVETLRPV
jgi:UDP-2,4-diacetamido-2,4,6-trideoxy-beta-L-altropyranose hydrolase